MHRTIIEGVHLVVLVEILRKKRIQTGQLPVIDTLHFHGFTSLHLQSTGKGSRFQVQRALRAFVLLCCRAFVLLCCRADGASRAERKKSQEISRTGLSSVLSSQSFLPGGQLSVVNCLVSVVCCLLSAGLPAVVSCPNWFLY